MFLDKTFSRPEILLRPKVFRPEILSHKKKNLIWNFFWTQNFFWAKIIFRTQNCFGPKNFLKVFFRSKIFWTHNFFQILFSDQNLSLPQIFFLSKISLEPKKFFQTQICLGPKIFRPENLLVPKTCLNQNFYRPKFFSYPFFFQTKIPPQTFQLLLDMIESWNFAHTLTRLTWLR